MGIPGGWGLAARAQSTVKVRDLGGQTVLEDGMILLVRGAIKHSAAFFGTTDARYEPAVAYVKEALAWWHCKGVRAVLGLDGAKVGAKSHAHGQREQRRTKVEQILADADLEPEQRARLLKQVPTCYTTSLPCPTARRLRHLRRSDPHHSRTRMPNLTPHHAMTPPAPSLAPSSPRR